VEQAGEGLDPVDQARTGSGEAGVGVDREEGVRAR
jgi:hypothetical protein